MVAETRVLDTTAFSALMRGDAATVDQLAALGPSRVLVPQPVVAEIAYGLARLPASRRSARLAARFALLLSELRRAEWTDGVSRRFGEVKADLERRGTPLEDFDIAIAAHALAGDAVLVTSNARHMGKVPGLRLEAWAGPR